VSHASDTGESCLTSESTTSTDRASSKSADDIVAAVGAAIAVAGAAVVTAVGAPI